MKFEEQQKPPGKLQYIVAWLTVGTILLLHELHRNLVTATLYGVLCVVVFGLALGLAVLLFGDNLSAKLQAITVLRRPMPWIMRADYVLALVLAAVAFAHDMAIFGVLQVVATGLGLALRQRLIRISDAYQRGLN